MPENYSAQSSATTVAPFGTTLSSASGVGVGFSQSSRALTNVFQETKIGEADSLLKALEIIFKGEEAREQKPLGLDLLPEELQNILGLTRVGVASMVNNLLLAPLSIGTNGAQTTLDTTVAVQGIGDAQLESHKFSQTKQASTLNLDQENKDNNSHFFANCQVLCKNFHEIFDEISKQVDKRLEGKGSAAKMHLYLVQSFASSSVLAALGPASLVSLMVDIVGSSLRELSGIVKFSEQESMSPQEKNIYLAFSKCCRSFSETKNPRESLRALQELEKAILDFQPASEMLNKHVLSSPSVSVFIRMITAEPFLKSLQTVNASTIGQSIANQAMSQEKEELSRNTKGSIQNASLIEGFSGGNAVTHSQNVNVFCNQVDDVLRNIDQQLKDEQHFGLVASSAKSSVLGNFAGILSASLIPGIMGLISREVSGSIDFSKNDKGSKEESTQVLHTHKEQTGQDLDKLLTRVSALQERLVRCQELGVSAPVVLGASEAISFGSLIGSLNLAAGMLSALIEIRTLGQSPSIATKLHEGEKQKAKDYEESIIRSHRSTGLSIGTATLSDNLSLHGQLLSIMEKVVLIHRSYGNFLNFGQDRKDINSTGKSLIGFTQGNSIGFLLGSLGVIALSSLESGIGLEALFRSSLFSSHTRKVCEGPDRIELPNGSVSNFSFASNATRLIEEQQKGSSSLQTTARSTYLGVESTSSRSFVVALCQSGALKEMLRRLVQEEENQIQPVEGQLTSILVSDALMPNLSFNILKVLDDADKNNDPIRELNNDMAGTLGFVSNSTIASILSTHSAFISPIVKSLAASKKARVIGEDQKNEALSGPIPSLSTASNIIQAFTVNFMAEIKKLDNPIKNSSIIHSSEDSNVTNIVASCAVSLLCEELFELLIGRSFTLLDKNKLKASTDKSSQQSKNEMGLAIDEIKEDSGLGEKNSLSHFISAMRLTLSHIGEGLGALASELNGSPDLVHNDLKLHSSQQYFIHSMASSFSEFGILMSGLSAGLSNFPVSTAGIIDDSRQSVHSSDHELELTPVHSSVNSTKDIGSESTLITGVATDCASSIMTSATKLLLQFSILGMDSTLAIAKILEILSINPRPIEASTLESKASSQPNGLSKNSSKEMQNTSILSTIGLASILQATNTNNSASSNDSMNSLQLIVDKHIDQINLLEDEEEEKALGLKAFFELIIDVLEEGNNQPDYKELVTRFNRGGISLSNYHSDHGGIMNADSDNISNSLIYDNSYRKCNGASSVIEMFINIAFDHEKNTSKNSLLSSLKDKLIGHKMSHKAEQCWEYLVNRVIERLKTENTRMSILKAHDCRRNKTNWEQKRKDLLTNWTPKPKESKEEDTKKEMILDI